MYPRHKLSAEEVRQLMATLPAEEPPRPPSPGLELDTWPPVWKAVEESPQFEYGLLQPYFKVEEDLQKYDHTAMPYNHNNMLILNFLRHVRESRGYDIDNYPQEFRHFPLKPCPFQLLSGDAGFRQYLHDLTGFVVAKMNARAQMCGEVYNFMQIENVVDAGGHRSALITFLVKEVSRNPGEIKTVQAMVFGYSNEQFKLRDLRFKPQSAVATSAGGPSVPVPVPFRD